jgi:DNA-directed RNA polymerase beta subunit
MNIGVLTKIAIVPNYDEYEDSAPITKKLSEQLAVEMITDESIAIKKDSYVEKIVEIGDQISIGEPLIIYDPAHDDPTVDKLLANMLESAKEELVQSNITTVRSPHTGVISDIKIYSSVDLDELSPSLKKIVKKYYDKINKRIEILNKYANPDDAKYYKCGQLISEAPEKIEARYGKIKGMDVGDGVLIQFFIKYSDIAKKGDKITNYTALKGIISHVIDEGYEPYSDFRPDEEISILMAPGAVLARKTPSVILSMFSNKVIIELKRILKENYLKD